LDAFTGDAYVAQGDSLQVGFTAINRTGVPVTLQSIRLQNKDSVFNLMLEWNKNVNSSKTILIPAEAPITQPYWLEEKMAEGYYNVTEQTRIGAPDIQPALEAAFQVLIEGEPFVFSKLVRYKHTDPVKGELYQPLVIVPPVNVYMQPDLLLFKTDAVASKNVSLLAVPNRHGDFKKLRATALTNKPYAVTDTAAALTKGRSRTYAFTIPRSDMSGPVNWVQPSLYLDTAATANDLAKASINYDHIPTITYFYSDPAKILNIDLKTAGKKIGYIPGAGDKVAEVLEVMGYDVTVLTEKELARLSLKPFDAIVTGVRAYNVNEWLGNYYDKLMAYIAGGGNLIVQYNTNSYAGPMRSRIGPYPFTISRNRVTNENAPVTFSNPHARVLNYPNKIYENGHTYLRI
jgi:hypothetical protein